MGDEVWAPAPPRVTTSADVESRGDVSLGHALAERGIPPLASWAEVGKATHLTRQRRLHNNPLAHAEPLNIRTEPRDDAHILVAYSEGEGGEGR